MHRTHVFRDLRPYICTFEDCKDPDQQYDTLSDWIAHEISRHAVTAGLRIGNEGYTRDCPFCLCPNASSVHVALHLRRISCFSLPRSAYDREDSAFGSGRSEQAEIVSHGSVRSSMESVSWGALSENFRTIRESRAKADEIDLDDIQESEQGTAKEKETETAEPAAANNNNLSWADDGEGSEYFRARFVTAGTEKKENGKVRFSIIYLKAIS